MVRKRSTLSLILMAPIETRSQGDVYLSALGWKLYQDVFEWARVLN